MARRLYEELAALVSAYQRCAGKENKPDWATRHADRITVLLAQHFPGAVLDIAKSSEDKLTLVLPSGETVTARASLVFGVTVTVGGKRRDKAELREGVYQTLTAIVVPPAWLQAAA